MKKIITFLILCLILGIGSSDGQNRKKASKKRTTQKTYSKNRSSEPIPGNLSFTVNGVSFTVIGVQGGSFMMGDRSDYETSPVHKVELSSFYIGQTMVTQELWQAVMGFNPCHDIGAQKPVNFVTHNDCEKFIERLNRITGFSFRLPTEAEWEFAARGGIKRQGYEYAGSNNINDVAWYAGNSNNPYQKVELHNVALKKPNELGLYDMSGLLFEWCADKYSHYVAQTQINPIGKSNDNHYVVRGGTSAIDAIFCTVSNRGTAKEATDNIGFRLAASFNHIHSNSIKNESSDSSTLKSSSSSSASSSSNNARSAQQNVNNSRKDIPYLEELNRYSEFDKIPNNLGNIIRSEKENLDGVVKYTFYYDTGWKKTLAVSTCPSCFGNGKCRAFHGYSTCLMCGNTGICSKCKGSGKWAYTSAINNSTGWGYMQNGEKRYFGEGSSGGVTSGASSIGSQVNESSSGKSNSEYTKKSIYTKCTYCNGTGKCSSCNGRGHRDYMSGQDMCYGCNGTGKCSICYGTGKL